MGNISPFTEHGLEILPLIFSVFCELLPFHIQQNNFIKLFGSIRFNPLPFEIISRITIHLSHVPSDNVSLTGAVSLASMLTEIFLLQQAQGMPEPGWGRITDSHQWNTLLSLHNAQFYLLQRTPEVARSRATPLLDLIKTALTPHPPQKQAYGVTLPTSVLFIAGHDTNLANLGGALELNWTLPGQPDNTPPGGELVFERWRRLSDNSQWIQVSLVFQTLQQMRDKTPLSLNTPPGEVKLTLAGCEERNAQGMCSLAGFTQIVNEARIPACSL